MLISVLVGFIATCVYASFAEWFVHRYGMHTELISKWAFRRHAIQHHSTRRSLRAFYASTAQPEPYRILESSAVPILWFAHAPIYWLTWRFFGIGAAIGVAAAAAFYITAYEVIHFFIHTPRNYWFQRTRLFHFYCEYHRLHHHRARWNYNVVCPLADVVCRTFSLDEMPPEPSAPPSLPRYTGPRSALKGRAAADAPREESLVGSGTE